MNERKRELKRWLDKYAVTYNGRLSKVFIDTVKRELSDLIIDYEVSYGEDGQNSAGDRDDSPICCR